MFPRDDKAHEELDRGARLAVPCARHVERRRDFREVTRHRMVSSGSRNERGVLLGADLLRLPAARAEDGILTAGSRGSGRRPSRTIRLRFPRRFGDSIGTAESSACVYGCIGAVVDLGRVPTSTILPRYITAMRSET